MDSNTRVSRRNFLVGAASFVGSATVSPRNAFAQTSFVSKRPAPSARRFRSKAVDAAIESISAKMSDPELAWLFSN